MQLTAREPTTERPSRVAIAGNPNVGKATMFNALTGARQKVSNCPGTTVESRDGRVLVILPVGTPCIATLAVVRRASGRWKWALLQWGGLTVLAWVLAFVVYQAGSLLA